ncbi:ATP-binding protein [Paenibacillus sp. FSL P4-0338]|uniref:ATP-binding protein n=1 Tax=unclassified Paenibacillus TaxID=185978 RepID=UPI0003E28DF9|nr:ATP-binding protein [Paenibacillus sp. FSL R7-269]ETT30734.1 anti-sigma regulatory factor, serine/threonine protein kinase [Paenibacillus sp. FSL R7-269]
MNNLSDKTYGQILVIYNRDDIVLAIKTTRKIAQISGFSEHESILLQLVTEEACMNAFEHGSSSDICRFRVSWLVESDIMEIKVCQSGGSFELHHEQVSPFGLHGRGMMLIHGIMDEVRLISEDAYVTLYMTKKRRVT